MGSTIVAFRGGEPPELVIAAAMKMMLGRVIRDRKERRRRDS
jgi:hypothetical protein